MQLFLKINENMNCKNSDSKISFQTLFNHCQTTRQLIKNTLYIFQNIQEIIKMKSEIVALQLTFHGCKDI